MAEERKMGTNPVGFSGLDSLVTDISQDLRKAEETIGRNMTATPETQQTKSAVMANPSPSETRGYPNPPNTRKAGPSTSNSKGSSPGNWIIGIIAIIGIIWYLGSKSDERSISKPTSVPRVTTSSTSAPAPAPVARPAYVRPALAPNGKPWPGTSGYIPGYKRLNNDGLSVITVDNTQNDSDVFVKLIYHQTQTPVTVRAFFIRAYDKFKLSTIRAGLYDIRYKDLDSGVIAKCDPFALEEIQVVGGTQYSVMKLTLYKVRGGNLTMQRISEEEF